MDFVEIMVPVIEGKKWYKFWHLIEPDYNLWGCGYDFYMVPMCKFFRMGIVDSKAAFHIKPLCHSKSQEEAAELNKDFQRFLNKNENHKKTKMICMGHLK